MHTHTFFSFLYVYGTSTISISPAQLSKIRRGLPIQIKHGSIGNGDMVIAVHPENAKKMMKMKYVLQVY